MRAFSDKTTNSTFFKKIFKNAFGAFLFFCILFCIFSGAIFAKEGEGNADLIISEIMYDPKGADGKREWIEVVNVGEELDLKKIESNNSALRSCREIDEDGDCEKSNPIYFEGKKKIAKNEIFILTGDIEVFKENYPDCKAIIFESNFKLKNGDKNFIGLYIKNEEDETEWINKVNYSSKWGGDDNGRSIEKISLNKKNDEDNWTEAVCVGCACATPGKKYEKIDIEYPDTLKIWEILPNPDESENSICRDEFIELKNIGEEDIGLGGWRLADKAREFVFPCDAEISAGSFLAISEEQSGIQLNDSGKERVFLFNPSNKDPVDAVEYENSTEGISLGIKNGRLAETSQPTPGEENIFPDPPDTSKKIIISELMPNPEGSDSENEWAEIYYFGEGELLLKGWKLEDKSGRAYVFSEDEKIKSGEYMFVNTSSSSLSLNNSNEEVYLIDPFGGKISKVEYEESFEGQSLALAPGKKYKWTEVPTPGKKNFFPKPKKYPQGLILNEILSNPDGRDKGNEWVEIFNTNKFEIDLSGWKLENVKGKKFEIASGKTSPGGYFVARIKNTSFYIRNSEERISLLNPNEKKVNEVNIPGSALSGASYNRSEKGNWSWSRKITPGAQNILNHPPKIKVDLPKRIYEDIRVELDASETSDPDGDELKFRWDFGDGRRSYLEETKHTWKKEGKYQIELRVDDGSIQVFKNFEIEVEEYPEPKVRIVKLISNPVGKDAENEAIWIKNEEDEDINLRGWSIATGGSMDKLINHPVREDFEIKGGEIEKITRSESRFSLLNKKGRVVLRYPSGETADKVKYEKQKIEEGEVLEIGEDGELNWILIAAGAQQKQNPKLSKKTNVNDEPKVKGVSFYQFLVRGALNKEKGCCENIKKVVVDNWKHKNQNWLKLLKHESVNKIALET